MAVVVNGVVSLSRGDYAAQGKYFVAGNPTPGTGVLAGTVTAFSATADGLFTLSNGAAPGGASIRMQSLVLNLGTTPPTATTDMKMAFFIETGIVAPSAGNSAVVPRNALVTGPASIGTLNVFVSAMCTIPAAVGTRTLVGNINIPTSLGILGDTYAIALDGTQPDNGGLAVVVRATVPTRIVAGTAAPIIIPPQSTLIADWWWVGQATNGPTFEYEIAWVETTA